MAADSASVLAWREELSALEGRLGELFVRAEPRRQAGLYLEGLLSAAKRKRLLMGSRVVTGDQGGGGLVREHKRA